MFSMMTPELSHFEVLLIFVQFKNMIIYGFPKFIFSLNGIHAVK